VLGGSHSGWCRKPSSLQLKSGARSSTPCPQGAGRTLDGQSPEVNFRLFGPPGEDKEQPFAEARRRARPSLFNHSFCN